MLSIRNESSYRGLQSNGSIFLRSMVRKSIQISCCIVYIIRAASRSSRIRNQSHIRNSLAAIEEQIIDSRQDRTLDLSDLDLNIVEFRPHGGNKSRSCQGSRHRVGDLRVLESSLRVPIRLYEACRIEAATLWARPHDQFR